MQSVKNEYYAHSREGEPPEKWHRLEDHLKGVAKLACEFANDFDANLIFYVLKL
jgi:hypothetical protein